MYWLEWHHNGFSSRGNATWSVAWVDLAGSYEYPAELTGQKERSHLMDWSCSARLVLLFGQTYTTYLKRFIEYSAWKHNHLMLNFRPIMLILQNVNPPLKLEYMMLYNV